LNRLFSWGILIAFLVLAGSTFIVIKMVFGDNSRVAVPELAGLTATEATNQLQMAGLLTRIDQVDSNSVSGTVIAQSIPVGEQTDRGKIVTIKVSRGGNQIKIPDVRNKAFPVATQELEAAGLKVGAVIRVSDQLKLPNTVIAQNPAAPALVMNNRMVDLLVSEGGTGRAETIQVPDLRGQTEEHARQIVEQNYLEVSKVITIVSQAQEGTVVRTDPRAGTRVPTGGAIALHIAKAPEPNAARVQQPVETPLPNAQTLQTDTPPEARSRSAGGGLAPETPTWNPNQQVGIGTTPPPRQQTNPAIPETPPTQPASPQRVMPPPAMPAGAKVAKIRYQVPPLSRSLSLSITMNDQSGARSLRQQQVQGGEYISMDTQYSGSATVTVRLGDQQVWQEKYN
jgi:serine/threonine-protein kinase